MIPIEARKYNCLIELWKVSKVSDGYGGSTVDNEKITDIYARRIEARASNYNTGGQVYDKFDQSFIIRKRDIESNVNFVIYNGYQYTIQNIELTQLESQIRINCVNPKPTKKSTFDKTFDNTFL